MRSLCISLTKNFQLGQGIQDLNFGGNDQLEGKVHTNGTMTFSNWGCPDFTGEVNVTFESIEQMGMQSTGADAMMVSLRIMMEAPFWTQFLRSYFLRIILQKLHVVMQPKRLLRIASFSDQEKR